MASIRAYVARRIVETVIVIFFVMFINFFIINLAPGDPARIMTGEFGYASPEYVEMIRKKWGLDKPLHERFLIYLKNVLRGDLGYSYGYLAPVAQLIVERIPATLLLMLTGIFMAFTIGLLTGSYAGRRMNSRADVTLSFISLLLWSMPVFWLGLILVLVFSVWLGLFPSCGMMSVRVEYHGIWRYLDILWHLALPATTLALVELPIYFKIVRASVIEQASEEYVRTFRAVGMKEDRVFKRYVLRNALLPPVTMLGLHLGYVLSGAVLIEVVFGWPGLGRLLLEAVYRRDYPVLMGMYLITSICVALANLATDLVYMILDPRIKYR